MPETKISLKPGFLTKEEWKRVLEEDEQLLTTCKTPPDGYAIKCIQIYPTSSGQVEHYSVAYFDTNNQFMQGSNFQVNSEGPKRLEYLEDLV